MTPFDIASLGSILGVWAHPDDETYLSAGLMALAARAGQRVVCVTATRGELGSWDEDRWPTATMGAVRDAELMRCLEILGIREHRWLDYHDGACADVDPGEGTARVRAIVEEVGPDTVLTFGPDGMTDHADHKAVSGWAAAAFDEAAPAGARLYHATTTPEWAERFVPILNRFDVFAPGTPPVTPRADLAIDLELPPDVLALKMEGIRAHRSQVEGMISVYGPELFAEANVGEYFRLAVEA